MKAKEYAEKYRANPTDQTLGKILIEMLVETKTIFEQRHAKSDSAMFAIMNEARDKWKAFTRLSGDPQIRPDGFEAFIQKDFGSEIYLKWLAYNKEL